MLKRFLFFFLIIATTTSSVAENKFEIKVMTHRQTQKNLILADHY